MIVNIQKHLSIIFLTEDRQNSIIQVKPSHSLRLLNKLYYFMPYRKGKGVRDLYYIKVARIGSKHEVHPDADPNDVRLVFEIEFVKQLFPDYKPIRLAIWETFTDTTLEKILDL